MLNEDEICFNVSSCRRRGRKGASHTSDVRQSQSRPRMRQTSEHLYDGGLISPSHVPQLQNMQLCVCDVIAYALCVKAPKLTVSEYHIKSRLILVHFYSVEF